MILGMIVATISASRPSVLDIPMFATDVSDDGCQIVGSIGDLNVHEHAVIWSAKEGLRSLCSDHGFSRATQISGNGSTILLNRDGGAWLKRGKYLHMLVRDNSYASPICLDRSGHAIQVVSIRSIEVMSDRLVRNRFIEVPSNIGEPVIEGPSSTGWFYGSMIPWQESTRFDAGPELHTDIPTAWNPSGDCVVVSSSKEHRGEVLSAVDPTGNMFGGGGKRAFTWTPNGCIQYLPSLPNVTSGMVRAIQRDGVIYGVSTSSPLHSIVWRVEGGRVETISQFLRRMHVKIAADPIEDFVGTSQDGKVIVLQTWHGRKPHCKRVSLRFKN